MISLGEALTPVRPRRFCIWGVSGMDLARRENTPPPSEISAES